MFSRTLHWVQTIDLEVSNEMTQFSLLSKFACQTQIVSPGKLKSRCWWNPFKWHFSTAVYRSRHTGTEHKKNCLLSVTVCLIFCLNSQLFLIITARHTCFVNAKSPTYLGITLHMKAVNSIKFSFTQTKTQNCLSFLQMLIGPTTFDVLLRSFQQILLPA